MYIIFSYLNKFIEIENLNYLAIALLVTYKGKKIILKKAKVVKVRAFGSTDKTNFSWWEYARNDRTIEKVVLKKRKFAITKILDKNLHNFWN